MKDQLYLLRPGFTNGGKGPLYCSDSAPVEGLLSFFPQLRQLIDIHYLEFPRPREPLAKTLGDQHQSLPVLVLATERKIADKKLEPHHANGKWFLNDQSSIRQYLSTQYDLPQASE
jgi:Protein of unknown function (DUF3088)